MATKQKEDFEPLPLYIHDDYPVKEKETKQEPKDKRGVIEIEISDNSLESLEIN